MADCIFLSETWNFFNKHTMNGRGNQHDSMMNYISTCPNQESYMPQTENMQKKTKEGQKGGVPPGGRVGTSRGGEVQGGRNKEIEERGGRGKVGSGSGTRVWWWQVKELFE